MNTPMISAGSHIATREAMKSAPGIANAISWIGRFVTVQAPESVKLFFSNAAASPFGQSVAAFFNAGSPLLARAISYAAPVVGTVLAIGTIEAIYGMYDEHKAKKVPTQEGQSTPSEQLAVKCAHQLDDELTFNFAEKSEGYNKLVYRKEAYERLRDRMLMTNTEALLTLSLGTVMSTVATSALLGTTIAAAAPGAAILTVGGIGLTALIRGIKKAIYARKVAVLEVQTKQIESDNGFLFAAQHQQAKYKRLQNDVTQMREQLMQKTRLCATLQQQLREQQANQEVIPLSSDVEANSTNDDHEDMVTPNSSGCDSGYNSENDVNEEEGDFEDAYETLTIQSKVNSSKEESTTQEDTTEESVETSPSQVTVTKNKQGLLDWLLNGDNDEDDDDILLI